MGLGLFIAGTDTGVGKTLLTAALGLALKALGYRVVAMKPVETGLEDEPIPDSLYLKTLLNSKEPIEAICPFRFLKPLAPDVAAGLEGRRIEPLTIKDAYEALKGAYDIVLVEGVGGLLVPLTGGFFVIDLIGFLGLDALLVARRGLGTINHTLLSLEALKARGLSCLGVILSDTESKCTLAGGINPTTLKGLMGVPSIGVFPFLPENERFDPTALAKEAKESLDIQAILLKLHS